MERWRERDKCETVGSDTGGETARKIQREETEGER